MSEKRYNSSPATTPVTTLQGLNEALQIPALRTHQRASISAAKAGRDAAIFVPTGAGKFEGFVGGFLVTGGVGVIVSPLIALAADQQRRLENLGIPCRVWNSTRRNADKDETIRLLNSGWEGLIITTPESLRGKELSAALVGRVHLFTVDEAHCVIRDQAFRPSFAALRRTMDRINPAIRHICSATVRADDRKRLIDILGLVDPLMVAASVARSNLEIRIVDRHRSTLSRILDDHHGQAGILYCATVATATKLHAELVSQQRNVTLYHGKLKPKEKKEAQREFMLGEKLVAVATHSLILGIDHGNLRFSIHWDPPESTENWLQGFGRIGRDGSTATAYGCFKGSDEGMRSRQFLIHSTYPPLRNYLKTGSDADDPFVV